MRTQNYNLTSSTLAQHNKTEKKREEKRKKEKKWSFLVRKSCSDLHYKQYLNKGEIPYH